MRSGKTRADEKDGDWEVEFVSAVVGALTGEEESETRVSYTFFCARQGIVITVDHGRREIKSLTEPTFSTNLVHRLTATLAFLI